MAEYVRLLDLTSLNESDTPEVIATLCANAKEPVPVAAVCVYPKWVKQAADALHGSSSVFVATVVNFPTGQASPEDCRATIDQAKADGVDEIDFVIDWRKFKEDHDVAALGDYVRSMVALCKPARTKAILETSQLTDEEVATTARVCIASGVDFIKTSTGKVAGGASTHAVRIMANEVKVSKKLVGIKPSGGIKNEAQCKALLDTVVEVLGPEYRSRDLFRFGASSVRNSLLSGETAPASGY